MNRFEPFSRKPPSTRVAVVLIAETSEPASASVMHIAPRTSFESQNIGRYCARCSGVPHNWIAVAASEVPLMAPPIPAQPHVSSSMTIICVTMSVTPPPPNSSG
jgi:hypothetical protein